MKSGLPHLTKNLSQLQRFSIVTGHDWTIDIATLKEMQIHQIHKVADCYLQSKMVKAGRVDFGLLVGLKGTRHFMVSKAHPNEKKVYQCLEKGLNALRGPKSDLVKRRRNFKSV